MERRIGKLFIPVYHNNQIMPLKLLQYHGVGTFTWPNGSTYRGNWKEGVENGNGVFKSFDEKVSDREIYGFQVKLEGVWENGKFTKNKEDS